MCFGGRHGHHSRIRDRFDPGTQAKKQAAAERAARLAQKTATSIGRFPRNAPSGWRHAPEQARQTDRLSNRINVVLEGSGSRYGAPTNHAVTERVSVRGVCGIADHELPSLQALRNLPFKRAEFTALSLEHALDTGAVEPSQIGLHHHAWPRRDAAGIRITALLVVDADDGAALARKIRLDALFLLSDHARIARCVGLRHSFEGPEAIASAEVG